MEIPRSNVLNKDVASPWFDIAGPVEDFSEGVQQLWTIDELIHATDYRVFAIPHEEVILGSMNYINSLITRLTKSRDQLLKNRGRMEIFFPEYNYDNRELYEIPEVRKWFAESVSLGIPWFYFLDTRTNGNSITLLLSCLCELEVKQTLGERRLIEVSTKQLSEWTARIFQNLNVFTEGHNISIEINKEISLSVTECIKARFNLV